MALAGLLVDLRALVANGWSLAAVPQLRGREFDRTVAMLMHVPVDECSRPLAGLILAGKGPTGVLRPVFAGIWQCRTAPRSRGCRSTPAGAIRSAAPRSPPHLQRGGTHGAAVIGVQEQLALALLADPLPASRR